MKDILYKKRCDTHNRTKAFSILQRTEDTECVTKIHKSFRYMVYKTDKETAGQLEPPQVYIKKFISTSKCLEKFSFQIKGTLYITHKDHVLRVDFQHTLNIHLTWKSKSFLPKHSTIVA